jgi:hypothetical protein
VWSVESDAQYVFDVLAGERSMPQALWHTRGEINDRRFKTENGAPAIDDQINLFAKICAYVVCPSGTYVAESIC